MEKSSYLEYFDGKKIRVPYGSMRESLREAVFSLLVLGQLREQVQAGAVSREFAAGDWELTQAHIRVREKLSDKTPTFGGLCRENRFSSYEALLFAAAAGEFLFKTEGLYSAAGTFREQWSRINENRKADYPTVSGAGKLYEFMMELQSGEFLPDCLKSGNARLFLTAESLRGGEGQRLSLKKAAAAAVLEIVPGQPEGFLASFCRRRFLDEELPELLVYEELEKRLIRIGKQPPEGKSILLLGREGSGKERLAAGFAKALGRNLLVMDCRLFNQRRKENPTGYFQAGETGWNCDLESELLFSGDVLYVSHAEGTALPILRACTGRTALFGAESREKLYDESLEGFRLPGEVNLTLENPTAEQRAALWSFFLKDRRNGEKQELLDPGILGSKYILNAGEIQRTVFAARQWAGAQGKEGAEPCV